MRIWSTHYNESLTSTPVQACKRHIGIQRYIRACTLEAKTLKVISKGQISKHGSLL